MVRKLLYAVLPQDNAVHIGQRPFQPPLQKPGSHGGVGIIKKLKKCAFPAAIPHISGNFQIPKAFLRKGQGVILPNGKD